MAQKGVRETFLFLLSMLNYSFERNISYKRTQNIVMFIKRRQKNMKLAHN